MSKVTVLMSCMHQTDTSIVARSNIQTNCVVVNQCDTDNVEEYDFVNKFGQTRHVKFISTTERGLSRSRNRAIENADKDSLCVIADDDEIFVDNLEELVSTTYQNMSGTSLIAFALIRKNVNRKYPDTSYRIGFRKALKITSHQITFRREAIIKAGIHFDVKMGSGTGNGGGEENKFVLDCLRKHLKAHYFPAVIAVLLPGDSKWYRGHDSRFLYNNGWASRRLLGTPVGFAYICYSVYHLRPRYLAANVTAWQAFKSLLSGFLSKR